MIARPFRHSFQSCSGLRLVSNIGQSLRSITPVFLLASRSVSRYMSRTVSRSVLLSVSVFYVSLFPSHVPFLVPCVPYVPPISRPALSGLTPRVYARVCSAGRHINCYRAAIARYANSPVVKQHSGPRHLINRRVIRQPIRPRPASPAPARPGRPLVRIPGVPAGKSGPNRGKRGGRKGLNPTPGLSN